MKYFLRTFLLAVGLGVAAFVIHYTWQMTAHAEPVAGEIDWLRYEFNLDAAQFARVQELHTAYSPVCEDLCDRVIEAKVALEEAIMSSSYYSEEVEKQVERLSRVKEDCHRSMLKHVYEVASVMSEADRLRYLEMAKAQITGRTHVHPE